ncbi:MAG: hypothetical protein AB1585_21840 [Thermodesulfobacteriota bacterium]
MKRYLFICLFFLLIPLLAEANEKVIQLQYKPKSSVNVQIKKVPPIRIFWEGIRDTRKRPREIGENQEEKNKFIRIVTSDDRQVRNFILTVLKNEFNAIGLRLANNADTADRLLSGSVMEFWTIEGRTYNSETRLALEIKDKAGTVLFKHVYSGVGTNRGRSLSEVNYQESISESLVRVTEQILADSAFLAALVEESKPAPSEEKTAKEKTTEVKPEKEKKDKSVQEKPAGDKPSEEKKNAEIQAEQKKLEAKRLEEIRAEEKRLEEKRLLEKRAAEKRQEEIRAEEKRLEELREEIKRLEEKKAEEKRQEEIRAEEKRLEEIRAELKRLEEKRAQETTATTVTTEGAAEEKSGTKTKTKKPSPSPTQPAKTKDPYFGPK